MAATKDPTDAVRQQAMTFPGIAKDTACTQSPFKAGKGTFLFIGPGPKGKGFKAMFKLQDSMPQARKLAVEEPGRFEVGSTGWVTARFTAEKPLPKKIWGKWLSESYKVTAAKTGPTAAKRK
jgi:hypothetical protein